MSQLVPFIMLHTGTCQVDPDSMQGSFLNSNMTYCGILRLVV